MRSGTQFITGLHSHFKFAWIKYKSSFKKKHFFHLNPISPCNPFRLFLGYRIPVSASKRNRFVPSIASDGSKVRLSKYFTDPKASASASKALIYGLLHHFTMKRNVLIVWSHKQKTEGKSYYLQNSGRWLNSYIFCDCSLVQRLCENRWIIVDVENFNMNLKFLKLRLWIFKLISTYGNSGRFTRGKRRLVGGDCCEADLILLLPIQISCVEYRYSSGIWINAEVLRSIAHQRVNNLAKKSFG